MRVNVHTDYALRVLVYMAVRPDERVPTATIAAAYDISVHHLHKVVRALAELDLLTLHRGAGGGVELSADPADVSIGAVVRALDDDTALVECFQPGSVACVIAPACALKGALKQAQEAFYAELDTLSLAQVVRGARGGRLRSLTSGP